MDQLIIPKLIVFFTLITSLVDIVLYCKNFGKKMGVKG